MMVHCHIPKSPNTKVKTLKQRAKRKDNGHIVILEGLAKVYRHWKAAIYITRDLTDGQIRLISECDLIF